MKEVFDGFQTKPYSNGIFSQTHKAVLLENFREMLVEVIPPSIKYQSEYDLIFLNKII